MQHLICMSASGARHVHTPQYCVKDYRVAEFDTDHILRRVEPKVARLEYGPSNLHLDGQDWSELPVINVVGKVRL